MGAQPLRIKEPFGTCVVSGEEVTVTPPHGLFSSRQYSFDRSRQLATITDRRLAVFSSKKSVEFPHISFGISQRVGAAYCIDMFCQMPNQALRVYELTGYTDSPNRLVEMKAAITNGTGIDRWE